MTVLYVRPSEIVPSLAQVPLVDILTVAGTLIVAVTIACGRDADRRGADCCVLGFWAAIVVSNARGAGSGEPRSGSSISCRSSSATSDAGAHDTPRRFRGFVHVLVALNLFLAVNGIVQYHTGVGLGHRRGGGRREPHPGTGIFNDPNDLGMTLVMAVPLLLWRRVRARSTAVAARVLARRFSRPMVLAMYYTSSRGAISVCARVRWCLPYRRFSMTGADIVGAAAVAP